MLRLKQLKIKNCRGIRDGPNLAFETGGLFLCGDNGTGKSSYIDAIEKILTNKCLALESGTLGLSWKKHGAHIKSNGNPEIELIVTDGNKEYSISEKQDPKKYPTNIRSFLDSAKIHPFILHRKTLLDFVNAKPSERYKAIEGFLQLDEFREFEQNLKELLNDCNTKYNVADSRKEENVRELQIRLALPSDSPVDTQTCIVQVNQQLSGLGIPSLKTLDDIPDRLKKIDDNITSLKHDENLQKWTASYTILKEFQKNEIIEPAGRNYADIRDQLLKKLSGIKGHFYAEVLEQGLRWIQEDNLDRCPLCNNSIKADEVTRYVENRIRENEEIIALTNDQDKKRRTFVSILTSNRNILQKFKESLLDGLDSQLLERLDLLITTYDSLLKTHNELQVPEKILEDNENLCKQNGEKIVADLSEKITAICSQFSDHERYSDLYDAKITVTALDTHQKNIAVCDREIAHYGESSEQIQILVKCAEQARKNTVQKLMDTIAESANKFYQEIHPDETIGNPQLEITDRGTGSIKLSSTFYGREDDPRGLYSEGHIDTLGLCLFLAICHIQHQQNPEFALLILDDVLHSVDADHRKRTADLIFREFSDYQIIITTHDRMWFEIIKAVSRSGGNQKKFKEYQISDWTLEGGPVLGDHLSEYEWLISKKGLKAQPADRVIKAGRLLEEILQNLCDSLTISVPYRIRGDYTIDPLWNAFYSRAKKQATFYNKAKTCLDSIDVLRNQRNWVGAHYNEWAKTLTDAESKDFTKSVIELRNVVYCEKCNQFIARIPQIEGLWSCSGEHLRYKKE